jgi:DnaJ-class molecular chaperone
MYIFYQILGVGPDADDPTIRRAYLDLVKRFSPEKRPEGFKRITRAYEAIKDRRSRIRSKLMGSEALYPVWTDALEEFLLLQREAKVTPPGLKELVEAQKRENGVY